MTEAATQRLVFDSRQAVQGADDFKRAADKIVGANRQVEAATTAAGKTFEITSTKVVESTNRQARQLDALARRYDPFGQSVRDATRDLEKLQRIAGGAGADAERAAGLIAAAQARLAAANAAGAASSKTAEVASASLARQSGVTSMAVRNLGIQSIDVFQQLASGAPVMMTLVQQGGQVAQMAAVTGTSLGALARGAVSAVAAYAPLIAATAGLVAFGAAAYAVFQRSSDLEAQQRTLSVAIQGVGRSAELSGAQLQGYVANLKQQGVAAAEATAAIASLARNSSLSPAMIGRIAGMGADAAAALGTSVPDAIKQLSEAAKGTTEAVQRLDDAFNLLNPTEASAVRTMIEHGEKAKALETVFDKLQGRISGLNREALSPMEQLFRDLGNGWDDFMNRVAKSMDLVAKSEPVLRIMRGAAELLRDANVSDLTGQMAGLQGQAAEQRRFIDRYSTGGGPARAEQVARARENLAEIEGKISQLQSRIDATVMPPQRVPIGGTSGGSLASPADTATKELDRMAAARFGSSDAGRMAALTREAAKYREELAKLSPGTAEYAARAGNLNAALAATNKEIADLAKKGEEHRTGLEKAADTYRVLIEAQNQLRDAYSQGRAEVQRVLATREAEQKAISEGLKPGTEKYTATVKALTDQVLKLRESEAGAKVEEQIRDINDATEAQQRIAAAYDGTQTSVLRAQDAEKAYATALRSNLVPGTADFASAVERLTTAYSAATDATRTFQQAQSSVQAIFDTLSNAVDRLAQGMVDAFLSGSGAAVNFGNIARSVVASVAADFIKLAIVNPLKNSVIGGSAPTLSAGLGALTGGSSSGGLLGGLSNVSTLSGVTDALGLTNIGGTFSSLGKTLGLTGDGGLFGGVSGLLNTPLWGATAGIEAATAANIGSAIGPGGLLSEAAVAGNLGISSSIGSTGVTLGQALSGVGAGFGAGSLLGGVLQRSLNRVGPAPTIGAGLGAGVGTLIGGPIGGLIGGLLGGAGGSLIGPRPATPFSATGLTTDESGLLQVGRTISQIVDTSQEVATLRQQVAQINAILQATGARIANATSQDEFGQTRISGGTSGTWLNFGQGGGRPSDLAAAFSELRFTSSNDYLKRGLEGQSFASLEAFQSAASEIVNFVDQTIPALKTLSMSEASHGIGTLATTIDALTTQFDSAITMAEKLGYAEFDLIEARTKAIQIANDNATRELTNIDKSLTARLAAARGVITGNPQMQLDAALLVFDMETEAQRKTFSDNLKAVFGDAFETTQAFADQLGLLEETRGAERLASAKSYLDAINAAQTDNTRAMEQAARGATGIVRSISDYVRSITFSQDSAIPASARYTAARSQFETAVTAARGGDAGALSNLTGFAETFRTASRGMFGSGQNYVADFTRIASALEQVALTPPETLTATVFSAETRTQTQTLVMELRDLKAELSRLRDDVRRTASAPSSARAA